MIFGPNFFGHFGSFGRSQLICYSRLLLSYHLKYTLTVLGLTVHDIYVMLLTLTHTNIQTDYGLKITFLVFYCRVHTLVILDMSVFVEFRFMLLFIHTVLLYS
uniref:Uncharacterized protein n=1 Tax=Cacopsylla melanoneura TaxID=428564 RepID=A0A8D8QLV1_9HEMI